MSPINWKFALYLQYFSTHFYRYKPVFIVEIIFVECPNELFVFLFHGLQTNLISILFIVRIKIIRKENGNIVETFHFNIFFISI